MCCQACTGHPECEVKLRLTDDCCSRCKYYETCMEELNESVAGTKSRGGVVARRKYVKR